MAPFADAAINRFQQGTMISTLLTLTAGLSIHAGLVRQESRDRHVFQAALIATTWLALLIPALDTIRSVLAQAPRALEAAAGAARRLCGRVLSARSEARGKECLTTADALPAGGEGP